MEFAGVSMVKLNIVIKWTLFSIDLFHDGAETHSTAVNTKRSGSMLTQVGGVGSF